MTLGQELLSSIFNLSECACAVTDGQQMILAANECFISAFGVEGDTRGKKITAITGEFYNKDGKTEDGFCSYGKGLLCKRLGAENFDGIFEATVKSIEDNGELYYIFMFQNQATKHIGEVKYKELFESLTQGFALHQIITDGGGKPCDYIFLDINPAFEKLTGLKKEDIIGKTVREVMPMTEDYWIGRYGEVALTGKPCAFEEFSASLDKHFSISAFSPKRGQFAVVFYDITDVRKIQRALSDSEQRFRQYIDNAPDGVFISGVGGSYTAVNKAACRITGYKTEEIEGKDLKMFLPADYFGYYQVLLKKFSVGEPISVELPFINKGGEQRYWSIDALKISDTEVLAFHKDITEKKLMQEKLQYSYFHDQLTGLYNRRYINQHRYNYESAAFLPSVILVGDINGLKVINSAFGHSVGDRIIKATADILRGIFLPQDVIAKWGGDEFIVIMPKSEKGRATAACSQIKRVCLENPVDDIYISISLGFAVMDKGSDFENAIKSAEDMMGKNKIYESESFRSQTINMILNTLHEKNPREEQHSVRVSKICLEIGRALGMTDYELNRLRVAGLMHDIGKIGIDEKILNKEGKLTEEEYGEIKKHPEIGYRILSSNNETSEIALHILTHHERYDGRGYPSGIKGDKLSLISRILTISDSFDAMTSQRPYRRAMTKAEAIEELRLHSGKQFDPDLVKVFVEKVLLEENISSSL